jgi:glycosyltransferase involved in cell wall biosynthesis
VRICAVVKYPPIQGGVSAQTFWLARALAQQGHRVSVVTNANEVESAYRIWIPPGDERMLEADFDNGGSVSARFSGLHREHLTHIPYSNPFVTKLSSLATEAVRSEKCELLFAYYYEPYGISAQLASSWTGTPFVVQNAGSDKSRLMAHPELSVAYTEMIRRASLVITGGTLFERLGVAPQRLTHGWLKTMLPREWFHPEATPLQLDELIRSLSELGHPWVTNTRPLPTSTPTIGVYGKTGDTKGSFDLVRALAVLRGKGYEFNFLAMVGGGERTMFVRAVDEAGLADSTWFIPFLPHWRVPAFIRSCTCVCFLERRFPVKFHAPSLPEEILACGGCAVLSREVADKQRYADHLRDDENVFIVDDPEDVDALAATVARVIEDPAGAARVGRAGSALVDLPTLEEYGRFYASLFERALELGTPSMEESRGRGRAFERPDQLVDAVIEFVTGHMPATARMLGQRFDERVREEAGKQVDGRRNSADVGELALNVADTLAGQLTATRETPADQYAAEVARFERDTLWLAVQREADQPATCRSSASMVLGGPETPPFEKRRPLRDPRLRITEFNYDVERAAEAAAAGNGNLVAAPFQKPAIFLWHKRGNLVGRRYRINARTKRLLDLCDGTRSVAQIEALLGIPSLGADDPVRVTLRKLSRAQVIALV